MDSFGLSVFFFNDLQSKIKLYDIKQTEMRELKSTGCVTVRDTGKRLSCMDNFSTADLLFCTGKMATK